MSRRLTSATLFALVAMVVMTAGAEAKHHKNKKPNPPAGATASPTPAASSAVAPPPVASATHTATSQVTSPEEACAHRCLAINRQACVKKSTKGGDDELVCGPCLADYGAEDAANPTVQCFPFALDGPNADPDSGFPFMKVAAGIFITLTVLSAGLLLWRARGVQKPGGGAATRKRGGGSNYRFLVNEAESHEMDEMRGGSDDEDVTVFDARSAA